MYDDHAPDIDHTHPAAIEPDLDELQQTDLQADAVLVKLSGPVFNQALPARIGNSRSLTVSDVLQSDAGAATETLGDNDDRRRYLTIICTGNPVYLGHDKQSVLQGTAGILPVGIVMTLPCSGPIYVRCATPAASAVVSYWAGYWAD